MNKFNYVSDFNLMVKGLVVVRLQGLGFDKEDIENALCSRMVDLEDTLNINELLELSL